MVSIDIDGNKIVALKNGQYMYNEINALYFGRNSKMIHITSSKPIYLKNELQVSMSKGIRTTQLNGKCYYEFSAYLMWDLLYKIIPSFFEKNVLINQTWITMNDLSNSVFSDIVNLKIIYPEGYIDLNGNKINEVKSIILGGRLCNYIGQGDVIVLNDNLSVACGFFSIDFDCKKKCNLDSVISLDENLSECNVDIVNGMLMGHLVGKFNKENVEKDICISIKDFFNSIICGSDKRVVYNNYVSGAIVEL